MTSSIRPKGLGARFLNFVKARAIKTPKKLPKKMIMGVTKASAGSMDKQKEKQKQFRKRKLVKSSKITKSFSIAMKFFSKRKNKKLPSSDRKQMLKYKA